MGNRKRVKNKVLTGKKLQVSIGGQVIPSFPSVQSFPGVQVASGNTIFIGAPHLPLTTTTYSFGYGDPLAGWDAHTANKKKIKPLIEFMRFLRLLEIVDNEHLREINVRFKEFNSRLRKKRETSPRNPFLKYIKEREKKKGKARRT